MRGATPFESIFPEGLFQPVRVQHDKGKVERKRGYTGLSFTYNGEEKLEGGGGLVDGRLTRYLSKKKKRLGG